MVLVEVLVALSLIHSFGGNSASVPGTFLPTVGGSSTVTVTTFSR